MATTRGGGWSGRWTAAAPRSAKGLRGRRPYNAPPAARAKKPADIENPFFTALVRGIEDVARDEGFRLMLRNSDEDLGTEAMYIDVAIAERMAGVVIAVASTSDSSLDRLIDRQIPVVAVDRRPARHDVDSVVIDNRLGGEHATDHPLTAGAERVGCITGRPGSAPPPSASMATATR